ncbi:MAG: hypothetical protein WCJ29_02685 [bacterium]
MWDVLKKLVAAIVAFLIARAAFIYFKDRFGSSAYRFEILFALVLIYLLVLVFKSRSAVTPNLSISQASFSAKQKVDPAKIREIEKLVELKLAELMAKYQTKDISDARIKAEMDAYLREMIMK